MSLIVKIGADVGAFKRGINTVSKDISNLGKGVKGVGNKFMPLTYGAGAMFSGAIKAGGDFQAMMSKVSAIGQVYGKDLDELSKKAREIGRDTKYTATEAAEGMTFMAQAGWNAKETLDGIDHVMNLAAASGVNVARVSDIVTDAITAMGGSSKDTAKYVDLMAITASKSNTNVDLMGDTYKYASQIAGTLGINMQDLSLAIGLMANSSVKGRQAGTSLRGGLVNLVKPTDAQAAAMEKYNIGLIKNKDGSVDLRKTMINLRKQVKGLNKDEQALVLSTIFGKNALSGWSAIVNSSEKDFNDMAKAIDNAEGSTDKMASTMMDNTKGDITIMLSSIEGALISVFEAIAPVVTDVAKTITTLANAFDGLDKGKQKAIIIGIAIAGLIGPFLKLTGTVITLTGKLKAIPVALKKMDDRKVERQVNAWLKWHRVSDEQAAKLRKVARDLDKVNRDGANAKTSANRLNKELQNIKMKKQASGEMKDLAKSADKAEREVSELKRELNTVKSKNVKINTTNTNKTITKGGKKGKKGKGAKGIGKGIAEDIITEVGGELGGKALQGIGGEIFGSIIGEGLAEGLTTAAFGGGLLTKMLGKLASLVNPVTASIAIATGAFFGLKTIMNSNVEKIKLFDTKIDDTGKKIRGLKGATDEVNDTFSKFSDTLQTFDDKGSVKKLEVKKNVNFEEKKKANDEAVKKAIAERIRVKEAEIKTDKTLSEKEKKEKIKIVKQQAQEVEKEMNNSNKRRLENSKIWNDSFGRQQWEAGQALMEEDLKMMELSETLHANSESEKKAIQDKYNNLRLQGQADFLVANQETLMTGLQTELNTIEENKNQKLKSAEEEHNAQLQLIGKRYKEGTPQYKKALDEEQKRYEEKKASIVQGSEDEKSALGGFIARQLDAIDTMERQGKITTDEADKMIEAMIKLGKSDPTIQVKVQDTDAWTTYNSWIRRVAKPIIQVVEFVTKGFKVGPQDRLRSDKVGKPNRSSHGVRRALGGPIAPRGTTLVGERGPELISRRGNQVSVQPLRATDRAMGGWNKRDLAGFGGGDTFQVTIVGHNKSAKELFDEIEEYKNNMDRHKGKRRY